MSEVSMTSITIGELKNVCDTQTDCSKCPFKCGLDKITMHQLCNKTIDTESIRYPVSIKTIIENYFRQPCKEDDFPCKECELYIYVTIGGQDFPVCIYDLSMILDGDYLIHFKEGSVFLSRKFIEDAGIREVLFHGEETK